MPLARDRKNALAFYRNIGSVKSPALGNAEIVFTSIGFRHLLRKGRISRTPSEQKSRLGLLKYVQSIIEDPRVVVTERKKATKVKIHKHGSYVAKDSIITFWTFHKDVEGRSVKVVISQIGSGKRQFLSIMDANKNKKNPH